MITSREGGRRGWAKGRVSVTGAKGSTLRSGAAPWEGFRVAAAEGEGAWKADVHLCEGRANFFVCVPRTDLAEAMFRAAARGALPKGAVRTDPAWETVAGETVLRFDGAGTYLAFPPETLPHGGAYRLDFEIFPETDENYVLLRQRQMTGHDVGLQLVVEEGKLRVSHFGVKLVPQHYDTALALPARAWAHVSVTKAFDRLAVEVNGRAFSVPYDRRARRIEGVVFGGNVSPGPGLPKDAKPFKGLLRAFSVRTLDREASHIQD